MTPPYGSVPGGCELGGFVPDVSVASGSVLAGFSVREGAVPYGSVPEDYIEDGFVPYGSGRHGSFNDVPYWSFVSRAGFGYFLYWYSCCTRVLSEEFRLSLLENCLLRL